MYDCIVIGAGVGGLSCAAKLASKGKKIIVIEKINHIGGTSHVFNRGGYVFPIGPLSFSFPKLVQTILKDIGITEDITFQRNHFHLLSPQIDITYSQDWNNFKATLIDFFESDANGINSFFKEFNKVLGAIQGIYEWNPDFNVGRKRNKALKELFLHAEESRIISESNSTSSRVILQGLLKNDGLIRLLGSQGSYEPVMTMLHLAFMWNVMSLEGIWFPSCGIHGINQLLADLIKCSGGEIMLNSPVSKILIRNGKAFGVLLANGKEYLAEWIVANADYKKVFLELIDPSHLTHDHLDSVQNTDYTGSELCVYLGIAPNKVDLSKLTTNHFFYRSKITQDTDPEDFENKEIEICLWSNKSKDFAPEGKKSIILRVNMAYSHFKDWRTGEKKRKMGYKEFKYHLAKRLINVVEKILPGLASAIEVMEVATPLTYQDWGQRYLGSIAGWTRDLRRIRFKTKSLFETPIDHLLLVGIYSFLEPFLGGYPVSIYSGNMGADKILEDLK
ncbi:MAG: NAD(P)/FAD-dependent oxidoreductase [Candidatus Lokiarchaeota archaeon]|nr:NAD(P)/FAD-dependent oxidoreductase [Candidatus Lokiarchaeota archaeon]